jgi:hypothetical protein
MDLQFGPKIYFKNQLTSDHSVFEPAAPRFTGPVVVSADIEGAAAALNLERLDAHIWARVYFDDFKRCCS